MKKQFKNTIAYCFDDFIANFSFNILKQKRLMVVEQDETLENNIVFDEIIDLVLFEWLVHNHSNTIVYEFYLGENDFLIYVKGWRN